MAPPFPGLKAHEAAGSAIKYVELGNEMYDSSRADVMAAYPNGSVYAEKMSSWTKARQIPAAAPHAPILPLPPEESPILGVICRGLLWAGVNTATPPGVRGRSDLCAVAATVKQSAARRFVFVLCAW